MKKNVVETISVAISDSSDVLCFEIYEGREMHS